MNNKYPFILTSPELENTLKQLIIQESEKEEIDPQTILDNEPLFGRSSRVKLDSLDGLQIAVAIQTHFKVRLQGRKDIRTHMKDIQHLAQFIRENHQA